MKKSVLVEKMWLAGRTGAFVLGALSVAIAPAALACDMKKTSAKEQQAAVQGTPAQPATAGMKVYIDPQTGEVVEPPMEGLAPEESQILGAEEGVVIEGVEAVPSPIPGGGTMLKLKGRFQQPLTATQESDGKVTIEHQAPHATTGGKR